MKIRSNIHAGYSSVNECQADANYWKMEASAMETYANTGTWPSGVPYPTSYTPAPTPTPSGGGYVNGVYYPDMSGACGGTYPPSPSGGVYINGVYYPDMSGTCG